MMLLSLLMIFMLTFLGYYAIGNLGRILVDLVIVVSQVGT